METVEPPDTQPARATARPASSPESAAFLARVRENLRGKLFGSTVRPGTQPTAPAGGPHPRTLEGGAPTRIGRYDVLGRIGSGGMGVIYSGYDPSLGRKVAVKLLNPKGGHRKDARNRLLREAQALARLSHPSVVHVYEVGEFEDQVFVAMEFVEGTTLRQWQASGERSWRAILSAYKAAAEGLAAGHAAGIIHRDFKPDNVLVRDDGEVRVIDFGLARTDAEVPTAADDARMLPVDSDLALTKTGTLMGTPAYMAPEQFKGETADARTDQFAFCVALYEALYGYRPFAGSTIHQLAANVLTGSVEAPPRYTDVPERMMRVLLRGLEVDPIERYDEMGELVTDLPSERPRVWLWVAATLVVLAVLGALGLGAWALREEQRRDEQLSSIRSNYVAQRGAEAETRLRAVMDRGRTERYDELILRGAESMADRDPTAAIAMLKALSAEDGTWMTPARLLAASASLRELQIRQVPLGAGPISSLAVDAKGETIVAGTERYGAYRIEPGASRARPLRGSPDEVVSAGLSSSGSVIVVGSKEGSVHVWDRPDAPARVWTKLAPGPVKVAVSGDGKTIAAGDSSGRVVVGTRSAPGRGMRAHSRAVSVLVLSKDGTTMVSAGEDDQVRINFLDEKLRWDLPHRPGVAVTGLHFGPDELFVDCVGADGQVWRVSTRERRSVLRPEVSQVGMMAMATGGPAEARYGAGQPLRVLPEEGQPSRELYQGKLSALAMSGDGRTVVAADVSDTIRQWRVVRPSDPSHPLIDASVLSLAHDPSRDRLALGGTSGLVRLWSEAGEDRDSLGQLIGGVHELSFSPQGRWLAALGGLGGITVWDLAGGGTPISLLPASFERPIGWSNDGTRLIAQNCEGPSRCALMVHALDDDERLLSTVLGNRIERFALSEASLYAVMVRSATQADVELFDVQTGESQRPPWPVEDVPSSVVGLAFTDSARALRLVSSDDGLLRLWHWEPEGELLTVLDELTVDAVYAQPQGASMLLRTEEGGGELWTVGEALRRPVGPLPGVVRTFELSADREVLLIESDASVVIVHVPTGIRRELSDIESPYAWRGLSSFALGRAGSVVLRDDPSPNEPTAFIAWLDTLTDALPRAQLR
ncbi:MAG: serine/threonine-protein kinase [Myxococcota bacterium]